MQDAAPDLSWWHRASPLPLPPAIDELPSTTPVVIVGAGMMGCSLARWLTRYGLAPLVIEQEAPAAAASGRNGGLAVVGASDEYSEVAARHGDEVAAAVVRFTSDNHTLLREFLVEQGLAEHWQDAGFLALWTSDVSAQVYTDSAPMMNALGWETRLLDRVGCEELLGTRLDQRFFGGAWTPRDSLVDPVSYVRALALAAHQAGARLAYPAEVRSVRRESACWRVETTRGTVSAEQVVLAANRGTAQLLPALRGILGTWYDTVLVTEPWPEPFNVGWAEDGVVPYGRPLPGGRLLIGGAVGRGRGQTEAPVAVQPRLDAYFARTFPAWAGARVECLWTGSMASSPDRFPLVGPWPGAEGLWLLVGFGGQGLPFSQAAPRAVAAAMARSEQTAIPDYLAPVRLCR